MTFATERGDGESEPAESPAKRLSARARRQRPVGWAERPVRALAALYLEYRWTLVLAVGLSFVEAGFAGATPFVVRRAVTALLGGNNDEFRKFVLIIIGLTVTSLGLGYIARVTAIGLGQRVVHRLRKVLLRHVQRLHPSYLREQQSGYLMGRLNESASLGDGLLQALLVLARNGFFAILCVCLMAGTFGQRPNSDPWVFAVIPVVLGIGLMFHHAVKQAGRRRLEAWARYDRTAKDVLSAIPTTRALAGERGEFVRLVRAAVAGTRANIRAARLEALANASTAALGVALPVLALSLGAAQAMRDTFSFPDFSAMLLLFGLLANAIKRSFLAYVSIRGMAANLERISEVLRQPTFEPVGARQVLPASDGSRPVVECHGVGMVFPGRAPLLTDVELTIPKGQKVGLIGPNGAGKTTLFNLILGLESPTSGGIWLNGVALTSLSRADITGFVSIVPQYPYMTNGTVYDNLVIGMKRVTPARVQSVLEQTELDSFISSLPQGVLTQVGEEGRLLSQGERKRLAVARCLLRDAELVLFDEATESLDLAYQGFVRRLFAGALAGKTIVYVTHRSADLQTCDIVYEIENRGIRPVSRERARMLP